jgi:hypothetical protein
MRQPRGRAGRHATPVCVPARRANFDVALFPSPRRGRNISAQGNALGIEPRNRVGSPERAKQHAEFIDVVRHLFCPFRARNPPVSGTRGGAALCPGLICFGPFGAEIPAFVESRGLKQRNTKTLASGCDSRRISQNRPHHPRSGAIDSEKSQSPTVCCKCGLFRLLRGIVGD